MSGRAKDKDRDTGRGRPREHPTRALTEDICRDIRTGCPADRAAQAHGISLTVFKAWKARGQEPDAHPLDAHFATQVAQAVAQAEVTYWRRVHRNTRVGPVKDKDGQPVKDEAAPFRGSAARNAMAALNLRWGRRYGAWRLRQAQAPASAPPLLAEPQEEGPKVSAIQGLTASEYARYLELSARVRQDFAGVPPADVQELQALIRKGRAEVSGAAEETLPPPSDPE